MKPFELGADGVLLLGCKPENCHFGNNDNYIVEELEKARVLLGMLGIWKNRLALVQLSPFDGHQFIAEVINFMEGIKDKAAYHHPRLSAKTSKHKET